MKLGIIGCGNMGKTYAKSFLKYDLIKKDDLYLYEKNTSDIDYLSKLGQLKEMDDGTLLELNVLVLAVKPQNFFHLAEDLKTQLSEKCVVVSIMAGITVQQMEEALNHHAIVRAMPNTPSQIGVGMTAFTASEEITLRQLRLVEKLFGATGRTLFLDLETDLDSVTALSGSGPAYVCYFLKSLIEAGVKMGLEEATASLLARQTIFGTIQLINQSNKSLDELIEMVTSKGGTTEAALKAFEEFNVNNGLISGILKAKQRSIELSGA